MRGRNRRQHVAGDLARLSGGTQHVITAYDELPGYLGEPNLSKAIAERTQSAEKILTAAIAEIGEIPGEKPGKDALMGLIAQDKKVEAGVPAFILTRGIGKAFIEPAVPMDKLEDFLARMCEAQ